MRKQRGCAPPCSMLNYRLESNLDVVPDINLDYQHEINPGHMRSLDCNAKRGNSSTVDFVIRDGSQLEEIKCVAEAMIENDLLVR